MNPVKLMGAVMIVSASSWVGLRAAFCARRLDRQLKELSAAFTLMECELRYSGQRFAPLCRMLAARSGGTVGAFFGRIAADAEQPDYEPVGETVRAAKLTNLILPPSTLLSLERLIDGFGRYDLEGQIKQLQLAAKEVEKQSAQLREGLDNRCRTYELLGICTGAAVMILVI